MFGLRWNISRLGNSRFFSFLAHWGQFVVELLVAVVSLFGRRGLGLPPRACLQTHHSTSCHSPLGVALLVVLLIASKP